MDIVKKHKTMIIASISFFFFLIYSLLLKFMYNTLNYGDNYIMFIVIILNY